MRSHWITRSLLLSTLVAGLVAAKLWAGEQSIKAGPDAPHVSPDARALLDKMRASYAALNSLDMTGDLSMKMEGGARPIDVEQHFVDSFRAPNQFRHDMKDEVLVDCTGTTLFTYFYRKSAYFSDPAPKSRAAGLPEQTEEVLYEQDPSLSLAISATAFEDLIGDATEITLLNDSSIDGVKCSAIKLVSDDEDVTVFVDQKTNLIKRIAHDQLRKMVRHGMPNVKVAFLNVDYASVISDPTPAKLSFDWKPPADAKLVTPATVDDDEDKAALTLQGKKAASFTLKTIDGKTVSFSDLKGHVVILDFFARWCEPCMFVLPQVDKVAAQRAGDGVLAFAIDEQDTADEVRAIAKKLNLSLPMLLDADTKVGEAYLANALPETVVIDGNGKVATVLLEYHKDEDKLLNDAIDAAIKAK